MEPRVQPVLPVLLVPRALQVQRALQVPLVLPAQPVRLALKAQLVPVVLALSAPLVLLVPKGLLAHKAPQAAMPTSRWCLAMGFRFLRALTPMA